MKILIFAGGGLVIGQIAACLIIGLDMPVGKFFQANFSIFLSSCLRTGVSVPFGLTGCGISQFPPILFYAWIPPMVNETIFCILMVLKAWGVFKSQTSSVLYRIIVRDRYVVY
jgi:hypothetical protein